MAGQSIVFMENHQISARILSICRQNSNSGVLSQRLLLHTNPWIDDAADGRPTHGILHNHQIHHNGQIYQDIRAIKQNPAVRFLVLVVPPDNNRISEKSQRHRSARSPKLSVFRRFATLRRRYRSASRRASKYQCDLSNYDWCVACICPYPFRWLERKPHSFHVRHENHDRKTASGRAGTIEFERQSTMTCRIDRVVIGPGLLILHISGQITGKDVDLLQSLLEEERSVVAIDLKDVLIVDREAIKLLAGHESNGVDLRNCPAYIREWVTRARAVINASGQGIEASEDKGA